MHTHTHIYTRTHRHCKTPGDAQAQALPDNSGPCAHTHSPQQHRGGHTRTHTHRLCNAGGGTGTRTDTARPGPPRGAMQAQPGPARTGRCVPAALPRGRYRWRRGGYSPSGGGAGPVLAVPGSGGGAGRGGSAPGRELPALRAPPAAPGAAPLGTERPGAGWHGINRPGMERNGTERRRPAQPGTFGLCDKQPRCAPRPRPQRTPKIHTAGAHTGPVHRL